MKGKGSTRKREKAYSATTWLRSGIHRLLNPQGSHLSSIEPDAPTGWTAPQSAQQLLNTPRRQLLIEQIWQRTSLSRAQFEKLYLEPFKRYAELVQLTPASESHHHAYSGGMLDHGLETVAYALKLRQSHLLPIGAPPETQAAQAEAWTAACAYAALLHDIGKLAVDVQIELANGQHWSAWHPPISQPYRLNYRKGRQYRLHSAATGLLYNRVLAAPIFDWISSYPELWASLLYVLAGQLEHAGFLGDLVVRADQASVAQALGGDPSKALAAPKHALQRKLLDGLRYLLTHELKLNQPQASDAWLTEDTLWLVSKTVSDKLRAHLLSQGIEGIPERNTAVFDVLQDHGIAQESPEGKAIWKATVSSTSGWQHTFTFLKVSPALIWELNARPEPFSGTVTVDVPEEKKQGTTPVPLPKTGLMLPPDLDLGMEDFLDFGLIAPHDSSPANGVRCAPAESKELISAATTETIPDTPSGEHFMAWLQQSLRSRRLIMNDAKALVHTVAETLYLVSPGIFKRYIQEHPNVSALARADEVGDWQWVQKRFEQLRVHHKQEGGLNIWTCQVTGPRKSRRLHGYLLKDPGDLIGEFKLNNPYLHLHVSKPGDDA
ncbi:MobH family relaxase [Pseudomonas huaxiensis]|uniref:MobH family relaxase n=1 Tax=Pseudomonas huaxiensis TaxID=2213017 RepID=UPI00177DB562|nr:MobH family relaxase [Pseudomonas huaxiensis]